MNFNSLLIFVTMVLFLHISIEHSMCCFHVRSVVTLLLHWSLPISSSWLCCPIFHPCLKLWVETQGHVSLPPCACPRPVLTAEVLACLKKPYCYAEKCVWSFYNLSSAVNKIRICLLARCMCWSSETLWNCFSLMVSWAFTMQRPPQVRNCDGSPACKLHFA